MCIRRSRRVKKTVAKDSERFVAENEPYVVEVCTDSVRYIRSINVCWSYPQFAREVLTNFNRKLQEVESLVNKIYYYNVDAVLIDEEDYNKLVSLGYVGSNLGQFKVEHVFKEIYIKSPRKWIGRQEDGSLFSHELNEFRDVS